jgi:hypothetical protein
MSRPCRNWFLFISNGFTDTRPLSRQGRIPILPIDEETETKGNAQVPELNERLSDAVTANSDHR